jgi:hypothetical protein
MFDDIFCALLSDLYGYIDLNAAIKYGLKAQLASNLNTKPTDSLIDDYERK